MVRSRELVGTNHISGMADRLRRCLISFPVMVVGQLLITLTVEICIQQLGGSVSGSVDSCQSCMHNTDV